MNRKALKRATFIYSRLQRKCRIITFATDSIADTKLASEGVFDQTIPMLLLVI